MESNLGTFWRREGCVEGDGYPSKLSSCAQSLHTGDSVLNLLNSRGFLASLCYIPMMSCFLSCSSQDPTLLDFLFLPFCLHTPGIIALQSQIKCLLYTGENLKKTTTEENLGNSQVYEN